MNTELPFPVSPGQRFDIDDLAHVLDRVDPDGEMVFRRLGSQKTFKVANVTTGLPQYPDASKVLELMADARVVVVPNDLESEAAAARRTTELQVADARRMDPVSDLRVLFCRRYDEKKCSLSDAALRSFYNELLLTDPEFHRLACAAPKAKRRGRKIAPWVPCGRTLRTWIQERGEDGDRQQRDGVSRSGRVPRKKKLRHPKAILEHWLGRARVNNRDVFKNHQSYIAELGRVSRGQPTGRFDDNGEPIAFPKPKTPYTGLSYWTFLRLNRELRGRDATEGRHGKHAAEADFGGGGRMDRATHVGAICKIDDTPVPVLCKVMAAGLIWVGTPTLTVLRDQASAGIFGTDLSWDPASSATVLRTVADASTPKRVPIDMVKHGQLSMMVVKPDRLVMDNLSGHHSRHVEDSLRETNIDADFTGAERPRDKADIERLVGTMLDLGFKGTAAAVEPIALRRHTKNDPPADQLPTLGELRPILARAPAVLNVSPTDALMRRSPLSYYVQKLNERKVNIIKDLVKFRRAIGCVAYDVELRNSGIEAFNGLRFIQPPRAPSLFDKLRHRERPSKRTKVAGVPVKIKYDPGDLGQVHVWDPVHKGYVTFECDAPEYADGLPKWVHELIIADIGEIESATCSPEMLIEYRARLFERQSDITQAAGEDERRRAARLADTSIFRRVMGDIAEVLDEEDYFVADLIDADHQFADVELSSATSLDAEVSTPRNAPGGKGASATVPSRRIARATTEQKRDRRDAPRGDGTARPPRPKSSANRNLNRSIK
ncbi:hypothetical protein [Sphingomonas sp. CROZ-RG-20F-R02-07]|uniref:hypothetical protein n=1 Tax=Sphingomonas sp. CROZ-RG-20F-R02-07 TaxID=2914832 RepID=UPI001F58A22C|nr:hypothetical protein [Sphingomonas sp. CROZ-RG-20F-R02-07]